MLTGIHYVKIVKYICIFQHNSCDSSIFLYVLIFYPRPLSFLCILAPHQIMKSFHRGLFQHAKRLFNNNAYIACPKNGVLTVHHGVEEITKKMLKKFYWTYFLIWRQEQSNGAKFIAICGLIKGAMGV
jgi:hypothetical protein